MPTGPVTADTIRAALKGRTGRAFWRTLEEHADTEAFRSMLDAEFPSVAPDAHGIDRRSLMKVMGASMALAGLTGCGWQPDEAALPHVVAPDGTEPNIARYYATSVTLSGFALPVLGKTYSGRPVKLEGNPDHPAGHGATDPFLQAALIGLYDPDRTGAPLRLGRPAAWDRFDAEIAARSAELDARGGEGFRLLTGQITSPTLERQVDALAKRWPRARWHVHEPTRPHLAHAATAAVFGRDLDSHPALDRAAVLVCLDADPLGPGPRQAVDGRRWAEQRIERRKGDGAAGFFVAEPVPTPSGALADLRLSSGPGRIPALVQALAASLGVEVPPPGDLDPAERRFVDLAATRIGAAAGRSLVLVGSHQPVAVQALGLHINARIGAIGATLGFTEPIARVPPDGAGSFETLVAEMAAGRVSTLYMVGVNPVYASAANLAFGEALRKVELRIHAGLHADETAALSHWHLPIGHDLESWSDARAVDGTAGVIQPLVVPFHSVRGVHALMAQLTGERVDDHTAVTTTWRAAFAGGFDERWRETLLKGFADGSTPPLLSPAPTASPQPVESGRTGGLTVAIRPDPTIWDGRFASSPWLQELPKPITKMTWGNVVGIAPALAAEHDLERGDRVRVRIDDAEIVGPVFVVPGLHPGTIALTLGYGRTSSGPTATGLGYDAYALQRADEPWYRGGAGIEPTGERETLSTNQPEQAMDGFDFVRTVPLSDIAALAEDAGGDGSDIGRDQATFYPVRDWPQPSWGMAIDLDLCIGCSACVVACVAENNIPMVGPELIANGREMHWLRVDHYFEGDPADPKTYFQPVPCMHCEHAPCEMGCPVNATVHSADGLNLQVYNRCIGTRTCSSFCPYKVRHFNWFDYTGDDPPELRAMRNPEVTVRDRGVMEKCTYCVQRIETARIEARKAGVPIADGAIVTACQQACPTRAIQFGDVVDPETAVNRWKDDPRNYALLEEVNTRPRTTYLARIEATADTGDGGPAG